MLLHFFFFLIFLQVNLLPFSNLILPDLSLHGGQNRLHNDGQLSATSTPSILFLHLFFVFFFKYFLHDFPLNLKCDSSTLLHSWGFFAAVGVAVGVPLGAGAAVGATGASHFPKVQTNPTQH